MLIYMSSAECLQITCIFKFQHGDLFRAENQQKRQQFIRRRPLVAVVIIKAAKEAVRKSSIHKKSLHVVLGFTGKLCVQSLC